MLWLCYNFCLCFCLKFCVSFFILCDSVLLLSVTVKALFFCDLVLCFVSMFCALCFCFTVCVCVLGFVIVFNALCLCFMFCNSVLCLVLVFLLLCFRFVPIGHRSMYSKFIKLIVLVSLLVCCGFAGRVLYGHLSQERLTRGRSTSHVASYANVLTGSSRNHSSPTNVCFNQ